MNKKSVEERTRIKEKNQKAFQDLSVTLSKLERKRNYKMDVYKHCEQEFKEHHLNVLQKKIINIKSHLSTDQLIELTSHKENKPKLQLKSLYSRIVKKINFEPHYEEDWKYIDSFLENREKIINFKNDDLESNQATATTKTTATTASQVSLPSIASNYLEDDKFFFKSKKIDFQKIYLYKKFFYERQSYEMKANEFARTSFSCHKFVLPKV